MVIAVLNAPAREDTRWKKGYKRKELDRSILRWVAESSLFVLGCGCVFNMVRIKYLVTAAVRAAVELTVLVQRLYPSAAQIEAMLPAVPTG